MSELEEFIRQHAKPYDPATDSYRRPPFAQPIKAGKNSPIYNAHSYHTKVPPEGIVPYIEHYTDPGDLILDPFCGSGMTGVAALMTGRHAILNDLSPAAVHIARNYCTPVDVDALRREFERIKAAVKDEFDWLYSTTCDRCGGPATIHYTIWSDVFECARCGGEIVLWDVAVDRQSGKVTDHFACPDCAALWRKTDLRWLKSVPVVTKYGCERCRPTRGEHSSTLAEKQRIADIDASDIPYWYPTTRFDESWEMWRGVHRDQSITDVSRFFSRRNLRAMACLRAQLTAGPRQMDVLLFAFTAIAHRCSRLNRLRPSGAGDPLSGTLYIGSLVREENVWAIYSRKTADICSTLPIDSSGSVRTAAGSATHVEIPDEAVDYVFTDPPFGSNIFYADCNLIWEAWLNKGFTDQTHEAVVHVKHKDRNTLPDYARLMTESFREMHRVLKPGRWASVVFHNSDDRIWQVILDAAEAAGFELAEINAFDKTQLSFKGIRGAQGTERVTNQDIVLNLRKPRPTESARPNGRPHVAEAEQRVVETVADFLAANPPPERRTLQHLWNHVLHDMLRQGSVQVSMAEVQEMLAYHYRTFKLVDGRYYLRGEAVVGGNVYDLATDAGAIAWLTAVLSTPQTTGDLIPKWQQETANLNLTDPGRLDRLLEQNFWLEKRTGRWRLPTAREREQMTARADLSAQAHLRVVRRFLAGQLERRPDDRELAAWLRFCYSREFYAEAVQLFDHLAADRLEPQDYREVKRMAAVSRVKAGPGGRT